ncbi:TonB-dependent siderophore receptor [bacterium M00.F.Ca.ET.228.01.1.1]|uniref:TonB-dependent siderophore receptor n=1 Tax=Paraburkholderia phenoliruptrix TaxID=252970 RepID=UPI00109227A6|nr:TonB-dependent siderophore receptor [Paraburkholderia phenoliruptrix]TGP41222.1 TonB-dependent siderophore receptor [bacterium M00.F.Ca.ET.228.01.1.1]TGR97768.1 TonB-dependent siderophore receptor [bacterium M00.F.Ca.ET.191.01.1.1]TGU01935.1 TonB-dependent siderophore receptor [bacterium M00.F.Ca.ET.155.01.1.1]MBW0450390.1 TonB-dependent siderophore receptor [Paraburkholderia phenoliruptrix]MBW9098832.1 TonB-dependent siderophore receptor [Paraburkholderia phenoliruptrix]
MNVEKAGKCSFLRKRGLPHPRPIYVAMMLGLASLGAHAQQSPAAASGTDASKELPAVQVRSAAEDPQGPGVGYVAKRSMTGTKTDSSLLTNPQSVSVVTRQQMDDQGAQTVDQALRYTPGVYSQDGTDIRFDQLYGRGFTLDSYLDGLHLYQSPRFATPRIDPYFMERMEVLHGPASVLYGQGSPGGLVNYVSKLPMEQPYHEVMMQIGNHDNYQLGFDLSGPVDKNGTVLYRLTGVARTAETQVSQIKDQRLAIAPSVTIRPNRDTTFTLQGSFQRDPNGGLFNPVPAGATLFSNPNGQLGPDKYFGDPDRDGMHRTQYWFGYQFDHAINDKISVSQNLRYLHIDQHYYQTSVTSALGANQRTVSMWGNVDNEHYTQFQVDTHAQAKLATGEVQHTLLFGLDYQRSMLGDTEGNAVVGTVDLYNPNFSALPTQQANTRLDYSLSTVGVYAQDEARWRNWVLTFGVREDWTGGNQQTTLLTTGKGTTYHSNDHAFTWRAGLAYEFENGIAPYIGYSRSFQPVLGATYSGAPFAPTKGRQVEAGVRYQPKWFDGFFSLAAFTLTQDNVSVTDPNHPTNAIQTGQIRSRGIEFEAHANVTPEVKVIASYTYLNQVVTNSTMANLGKRPTIAPRNTASLWADYTFHHGPLRNFGVGSGVRYMSSSAGDLANTFTVPGRVLVDLGAHYDIQNWRLSLNLNNVFDREYISYCTTAAVCYWGATRTVLGTARYQW